MILFSQIVVDVNKIFVFRCVLLILLQNVDDQLVDQNILLDNCTQSEIIEKKTFILNQNQSSYMVIVFNKIIQS